MKKLFRTTRRRFISMLLGTAAFFGFWLLYSSMETLFIDSAELMAQTSGKKKKGSALNADPVSVRGCATYEPGAVRAAVISALADIGFTVPHGARVLLKPNILAQNTPDQAATTHPSVVDALCGIFTDNGCAVTIGESSAFYQGGCTRLGFETSGIAAVARKYGARLLPFEATLLRRIDSGTYLNPFYLTEAVFEQDLVVNLPKLKVHRLARYTGAVKNIYGCVVGGTKQVYHRLFQDRPDYKEFWGKPLVDVYQAVNPGLTVMDAVVGLDNDGPAATGDPRPTGFILASRNGPALDVVMCRIIGFDPRWVPALREALDRGLTSLERAAAVASMPIPSVPYAHLPDEPPLKGIMKSLDRFVFDQFIMEPRISRSLCNRCGDCAVRCAPGAIYYGKEGYPAIRYSRCIYCYCCSEYCQAGAITLAGGVVNHLIRAVRYLKKI